MPGTSRAPKRSRVPRKERPARNAAAALAKVSKLTLAMEEPLNELENFIQALRFIGYGMETWHDDEGHPISSLAWTAVQRLDTVRTLWRGIHKAAQKRAASTQVRGQR